MSKTKKTPMFTERHGALKSFGVFIICFIVLAIVATTHAFSEPMVTEGIYSRVVWIDGFKDGTIVLVDGAGLYWEFESEPEDWCVGDPASVIMWDNGTPDSIYDDVILTYPTYGGIAPKHEEGTLAWDVAACAAFVLGLCVGFILTAFKKIKRKIVTKRMLKTFRKRKFAQIGMVSNELSKALLPVKPKYSFVFPDPISSFVNSTKILEDKAPDLRGDIDGDDELKSLAFKFKPSNYSKM